MDGGNARFHKTSNADREQIQRSEEPFGEAAQCGARANAVPGENRLEHGKTVEMFKMYMMCGGRSEGKSRAPWGTIWVAVFGWMWLVQVSPPQCYAQETGAAQTGTAAHLPTVRLSDLPDISNVAPTQGKRVRPKTARPAPAMPIPDEAIASAPKVVAATAESGGSGGATASAAPGTASPPASASFQALSDNGTTFNPDTQGAVGPNHVMATLSSQIRVQTRNGSEVRTVSLDSFWTALGNPEVFDPRVTYDPFAQRWIQIGTANFTVNPGLVLAVSRTSDPNGEWNPYFIDVDVTNPVFAEAPNVGFNHNWIVIQANMFNKTTFDFESSDIFVFNKTNLYAGGAGTFTKFSFNLAQFGGPVNAQVPAVTYDNALNTLYLLGHYNYNFGNFGYLRLYRITGTPSAPVFESPDIYPVTPSNSPWEPYPFEINSLPQSGTTQKINAGDARLQNVVYRNGSLWTAHTVFLPANNPTRAAVQWWEVLPNTGGAFQFGRVDETSGRSFAYPSIAVNARNDVLIGYSSFGATQFASAAYSFRTDQDGPGTLRTSAILKAGEASYYVPSDEFNYWGDLSATVVDPLNDIDMWTLQEYAAAPVNFWSTWWGRVSPPVDLVLTMTGAPSSILAGQNVTYTLSVTNRDFGKPASGVKLTDTLPVGIAYVTGTTSQGSGCSFSSGVVTCDLGNLAENAFATATITLTLNAGGSVNNTVTASANGPEMQSADNSRTVTTAVTPSSDLAVSQTALPNSAQQGDIITYSVLVTNIGPSTATTVKMTNTLPSIVTYQSSSSTLGSCSFSGGIVTCTIGNLAPQSFATVTILATATSSGNASNQAKVGSTVNEPNPANNTSTASTPINAKPTIQGIIDRAIDEDTATGNIAFTVGDTETAAGSLMVIATSSNQALVPDGNINLDGTGANRTIAIQPLPNQFGATTITRTVTDGTGGSAVATFVLTVNPINDRPTTTTTTDRAIDEDTNTGALTFTIGDLETAPASLTLTRTSSNTTLVPTANILLGGGDANRTVTVTPAANQFGNAVIAVIVSDGSLSATNRFTLTVNSINDLPTITTLANRSVSEDTATTAIAFTIGDVETAVGSLNLIGGSSNSAIVNPSNINFGGTGASRTVTVTPNGDQNGDVTITVTVSDGNSGQTNGTFVLTVTPVNDPPTLNTISNVTIPEDTGAFSVNLAGISPGPANEIQSLAVTATSGTVAVLPNPTVAYTSPNATGTLNFGTLTNIHGTSTINVTVDDGQSANRTQVRTFTVTVTPVNDAPTITAINNQAINEDATTGTLAFTLGDVESGPNTLTLSKSSSNTTLIPTDKIIFSGTGASRFVAVTPATNQFGMADITITADDGTNQTQRTFTVTVNPVNDPPTITGVTDRPVNEDTSTGPIAFTVGDLETPLDTLRLSATSSAHSVVHPDNITFGGTGASRTVSILPASNQAGTALVTLILTDGDNASVQTAFTLTVTAVNDPPAINAISNVTRDEDSGAFVVNLGGIGSGAPNETQSLTVTAASGNTALVPNPNLAYVSPNATGTLTISPVTNAAGVVTITVQVDDGASVNRTTVRTFDLTLNPINDPPVISSIVAQFTDEDVATAAIPFTISDVETPTGNLTLTATSSNEEVVSGEDITFTVGTGGNRTVKVSPLPDQFGSTFIFVAVTDGDGRSTSTNFELTVHPVNDRPAFTSISNQSINEDTPTTALAFTVEDMESSADSLTLVARSSNATLIPDGNISLQGTGTHRTVTVTPVLNQSGNANIAITAADAEGLVGTNTFNVVVNPVNDPPTLSPIAPQSYYVGMGNRPVNLMGIGPGGLDGSQSMTVTAVSSDSAVLADPTVQYASPNANGTLTLAVPASSTGVSTVSVTVQDNGGTDRGGQDRVTQTFEVTIRAWPNLSIRRQAGMVVLSWPSNHVGFRVEERDRVQSGAWTLNPAVPLIEQDKFVVRVPATSPFKVFRLTDTPGSPSSTAKLGIRIEDNQVILFWPSTLNNFSLQTRTQISSDDWENVEVQPSLHGNEYTVTLPIADTFRVFQLKQPWQ